MTPLKLLFTLQSFDFEKGVMSELLFSFTFHFSQVETYDVA